MTKKIVVIGAGIAGLTAGCYGRMNGFETEIYEMHSEAGGLCTSWKRKGYNIDGSIHWLMGTREGSSFYNFWEELGAIQGRHILYPEIFTRYVDSDGRVFNLYSDVDKLENHLKELSPLDSSAGEEFCSLIRTFGSFKIDMDKPMELYNFMDTWKMLKSLQPYMKDFIKCSGISSADFASRFKDPLIRYGISNAISPDTILIPLVMSMSALNVRTTGFPEGGSREFARAIMKRYLELGGAISCGSRVAKILVKHNRAAGILLENGKEIVADFVISACDLKTVIEKLVPEGFDSGHKDLFKNEKVYSTGIQVSFGLNDNFTEGSDAVINRFRLDTPLVIAGGKIEWLFFKNYNFDKTLAPRGKTYVMSLIDSSYEYWDRLKKEGPEAYNNEKEKTANDVLRVLDRKFPGFAGKVEMTDVTTPLTYEKYTGNWKGSFMTWVSTPRNSRMIQNIPKQIKGLKNFYMSGMWLMSPGGIPSAVKTARDVIQLVCRRDGRKFITTKP